MGYMIKNDIPYAGSPSNFTLNEASAYNPSTSYPVGAYCIYQNTLRKCTGETSGAFDESKWEVTKIGDEISSLSEAKVDNSKLEYELNNILPKNVFHETNNQTRRVNVPKDYSQYLCVYGIGNSGVEVAIVNARTSSDWGIKTIFTSFGNNPRITLSSGDIVFNTDVWASMSITKLA